MSEQMMEESGPGVIKKILYVNRRAPHGTVFALESLEVALIGAAFEQDVSILFEGDGVFELLKHQDTKSLGTKNFSPTFRALEMYDIEKLYVEADSLSNKGLSVDDLLVPVEVLNANAVRDLIVDQDVVLSF